jgi:hypothetical protein
MENATKSFFMGKLFGKSSLGNPERNGRKIL